MLPHLAILFVIETLDTPALCGSTGCGERTNELLRYICHDVDERSEVLIPLCSKHVRELEEWYQGVRT